MTVLRRPPAVQGPAVRPHHTPWPTTLMWRWRWEFGCLSGVLLLAWVGWLTTGAWLLVILPITVSLLTLVTPCRTLLQRHAWAIVVQHRVRVGCSQTGLQGRDGKLPAVLWTRTAPYGERVYLWAPPPVTIERFRTERKRLAAACRSRAVRVSQHPRFAQILILDVVRQGSDDVERASAALRQVPRPRRASEI